MEFWGTFWATMWGAVAGAAVGTVGAWLVALDLRTRDREDREQERRLVSADRRAEREQDRLNREAERENDRQHRVDEEARAQKAKYEERVFQRWPQLAEALLDYIQASRYLDEMNKAGEPVGDGYERRAAGLDSLTKALAEIATIAKGTDHEIVHKIGLLAASNRDDSDYLDYLNHARMYLHVYMTAKPEHRAKEQEKLRVVLGDCLAGRDVRDGTLWLARASASEVRLQLLLDERDAELP